MMMRDVEIWLRDKELTADFHEGIPIYIKFQSKKTNFLKQQMVRLESLKKATICKKSAEFSLDRAKFYYVLISRNFQNHLCF